MLAVLRVAQVRLRFFAVLAVAFLVVGKWDTLRNYWDKYTRSLTAKSPQAISPDMEYFCPMCPGVVSVWPSKCPVCNMALVRRKRGDDTPLPDGVVARMQASPYRLHMAGIQTSPITYESICKRVSCAGILSCDPSRVERVASLIAGRIVELHGATDRALVRAGECLATLFVPAEGSLSTAVKDRLSLFGIKDDSVKPARRAGQGGFEIDLRSCVGGLLSRSEARRGDVVEKGQPIAEIADIKVLRLRLDVSRQEAIFLKKGSKFAIGCELFPGQDFVGRLRDVSAVPVGETQILQALLEIDNPHDVLRPGMRVTASIDVPATELEAVKSSTSNQLKARTLLANLACDLAGPLRLPDCRTIEPLIRQGAELAVWRRGFILAVPEGSVVDTGKQRIVYVETGPGMFEGVEVALGPLTGEFYPVLHGLGEGQRVATAGAFLIDAETRLNPSLAAGYFGAARSRESVSEAGPTRSKGGEDATLAAALASLPPADRTLAQEQRVCPVTGQLLGSMGVPARVEVQNRVVFLCCKGCVDQLTQEPAKFLSKLPAR
jgi:Cu(I)/Ag(I) efflux system membrane fusion protein